MMTAEELDALPDVSPELGFVDVWVNDRIVSIKTGNTRPTNLFIHDGNEQVFDQSGAGFLVGTVCGVLCKKIATESPQ